jgi:hypothetical protein
LACCGGWLVIVQAGYGLPSAAVPAGVALPHLSSEHANRVCVVSARTKMRMCGIAPSRCGGRAHHRGGQGAFGGPMLYRLHLDPGTHLIGLQAFGDDRRLGLVHSTRKGSAHSRVVTPDLAETAETIYFPVQP